MKTMLMVSREGCETVKVSLTPEETELLEALGYSVDFPSPTLMMSSTRTSRAKERAIADRIGM